MPPGSAGCSVSKNRHSSVTAVRRRPARAPNGSQAIPAASNSERMWPAPSPTSSRPPVRRSVVAISRASSAGFQNGTFSTSVPTRSRCVASAAATSTGNGAGAPRWSGTNTVS